jgi:hypothetical protein
MVLETLNPILSNYFLNPAGLIALSALIPVIIFYLVKKDPEREIMPSFMFFQDKSDSESTSQALKTIARNLILIFHILAITVFALAFADPYLESGGQPENAVLVLDRSGSMEDLQNAKDFLLDNTGEENSVIFVEDGSRVVAEGVSASRAETIIRKAKHAQTETDIVSGLEKVRRFEGSVFIASDLDQTVDSQDPESVIESLRSSDREVKLLETSRRNRHGIVELDVSENQTQVDVKNFEQNEKTVEVSSNNQTEEVSIEGKSVETVSFDSSEGRNTVELEEDDFTTDDTAYYYIPEDREIEIAFISDQENRYIAKVFELIDFTSLTYYQPPVEDEINADIYIVGESNGILSQTVRNIESDVKDGSNLVLFGKNGFSDLDLQDLPVEDNGENVNRTVNIRNPVETSLGEMEIRDIEQNSGERYTPGSNALVRSEYGEGEFLLYNIEDNEFRNNFLYPVFWKEISMEMTDKPSINEANRETGEELNRDSITAPDGRKYSGRYDIDQTGFYETSRGTVAANMLSEDESLRDIPNIENTGSTDNTAEMSLQWYLMILILALITIELWYLYRIGDLQ